VDTAILVRTEREAAWQLLEGLKETDFPMTAAFWQYRLDNEIWRLFIATKLFDEAGSIAAYSRLQGLLNGMPDEITEGFSVSNISLISPDSAQLKKLRQRYGKVGFNRSDIRRFSLAPEEAYIYFLE
jgi:hypothetical protein